jgi:putative transferase (TIGR04331 family)
VALLATTALEWSWGEHEPLVFLGEWCRRYERSTQWRAREHVVVRNHWDDRAKLHRDQIYLRTLHDELVGDLGRALGRVHVLERSRRFWQTLIDPWLARYLGVAFDRWESLRVAFEEHDCAESIIRPTRAQVLLRDYLHSLEAQVRDEWNHDFYCDILRYAYAHRCTLRLAADASASGARPDSASTTRRRSAWLRAVAQRIDWLCGRLSRSNEIAFVQSYFPLRALLRLNLSLGQMPVPRLGEFGWQDLSLPQITHCDDELRRQITLEREPTGPFEQFLHQRIMQDLPQVLVESFAWLRGRAATIRSRPKVVFSANAHWFNNLFKQWLAERVHEGALFVAMEHGGSIPPRYSSMNFEEDTADVRTTWALPYHPKHIRLPPNRFVGRRRSKPRGTRLLVVGSEAFRYPHDLCPTPLAGQTLVAFEHVCRLHDALEERIQSAFVVKPYPNLGWCLRERFVERLGTAKVSNEPRLERALKSARVVVCTYPQTTFSQAMICGAPALLVYPQHLWETVPRFDALIEALQAAQLVFADPEAAADHINRIWSEPGAWWNSAQVQEARHRFELEALDMRSDWLAPWLELARDLSSGRTRTRVQSEEPAASDRLPGATGLRAPMRRGQQA